VSGEYTAPAGLRSAWWPAKIPLTRNGFRGALPCADRFMRTFRPPNPGQRQYPAAFHRSTIFVMQVATGTVINGKIVLDGVPLSEGAVVTVVIRGADESFVLTPAQEDELLAAMAEIDRGEFISLAELIKSLPTLKQSSAWLFGSRSPPEEGQGSNLDSCQTLAPDLGKSQDLALWRLM
jgi:hypothetical protein